jgi:hypothetical protein
MGFFDTLANQIQNQVVGAANTQINNRVDEIITRNNPLRKFDINFGTGFIDSDFKIDEFRNNMSAHNEVAKADKFNVVITIPYILVQGFIPEQTKPDMPTESGAMEEVIVSAHRDKNFTPWTTSRELSLQCEVSELPGRDVNMIEYRHYGFTRRIPHNNQYGQVSLTFYCTGDMHEKKFFDMWLDLMVPTSTGLVSYPIGDNNIPLYETNIDLNQFDPMGNMMYQATLIDAVPTGISALNQNWSDDSVHRLTVTFAFRKWVSYKDTSTGSDPATDERTSIGDRVGSWLSTTGNKVKTTVTNNFNFPGLTDGF